MIPLAVPNLSGNEARYLQECIDSTFVSSVGPFVDRFEAGVAAAAGAAHAVAVSSGTAGLHLALTAVGVEPGDLVVLPSYTFVASANAIRQCGALPWLLDVSLESWCLDPGALRAALVEETEARGGQCFHRETGRRVAAVMPVYALGNPADMDPIVAAARECALPVVADAAAALGARYRGLTLADCGADLSVFSFNGNKTVTCGGGGAIAGNDAALCERARHISQTARNGPDYSHDAVAFNCRMTNLQAAVGCAQLERLDEFIVAKRSIAAAYRDAFADLPGVGAFPDPPWAEGAHWMSGATLDGYSVENVVVELRERGVDAGPFWKPMHLQSPYADCPRRSQIQSDALWSTVLALPCSTHLSTGEIDQVIATARGVLSR